MHAWVRPGSIGFARWHTARGSSRAARVPAAAPDAPRHLPSGDARARRDRAHVTSWLAALESVDGDVVIPLRAWRSTSRDGRAAQRVRRTATARRASSPALGDDGLLLAPPGGRRDGRQLLERAHRGAVLRAAGGQRRRSAARAAARGQRHRRRSRPRRDRRRDPRARSTPAFREACAGLAQSVRRRTRGAPHRARSSAVELGARLIRKRFTDPSAVDDRFPGLRKGFLKVMGATHPGRARARPRRDPHPGSRRAEARRGGDGGRPRRTGRPRVSGSRGDAARRCCRSCGPRGSRRWSARRSTTS